MDQERIDRMTRRARSEPVRRPTTMMPTDPSTDADPPIKARLRRIVDRACTAEGPPLIATGQSLAGNPRRTGTMRGMMDRILARSMPVPITIERKDLATIRMEYEALRPDERRDELERHLWATDEPGRVRTCYSDLLDAMGTGR